MRVLLSPEYGFVQSTAGADCVKAAPATRSAAPELFAARVRYLKGLEVDRPTLVYEIGLSLVS
jgi:hypothetical protein